MKKIISILLVVLIIGVIFASCNDSDVDTSTQSTEESVSADGSNGDGVSDSSLEESEANSNDESLMVEPTKYHKTTIAKNANTVVITAEYSENSKYITLLEMYKKTWGTWCLGKYSVVKSGKEHVLNNGSTDWEYVMSDTAGFVGGNHGDESLVSIEFYDATSGKLLGTGDSNISQTVCDGIKIVEKTLVHHQVGSSDEASWTHVPDGTPFVSVVRTYYIDGSDIWLECSFDFIEDATLGIVYTAMYFYGKDYGKNVTLTLQNGSTLEHELAYGSTANGIYCEAVKADFYNSDYPEYHVEVTAHNPDDMLGFADGIKTQIWDMNEGYAKIYFAKSNINNTKLYKKGTHWQTLASWKFFVPQNIQ